MDEEEVGLFIQSIGRFKTSFNDRLKHRCVEQKKIKLIMTKTQACNAYTLLTRGLHARGNYTSDILQMF